VTQQGITEQLITLIESPAVTQPVIARAYSAALSYPDVRWSEVNAAILKRYRLSGLTRIKEMAWKITETYEEVLAEMRAGTYRRSGV